MVVKIWYLCFHCIGRWVCRTICALARFEFNFTALLSFLVLNYKLQWLYSSSENAQTSIHLCMSTFAFPFDPFLNVATNEDSTAHKVDTSNEQIAYGGCQCNNCTPASSTSESAFFKPAQTLKMWIFLGSESPKCRKLQRQQAIQHNNHFSSLIMFLWSREATIEITITFYDKKSEN